MIQGRIKPAKADKKAALEVGDAAAGGGIGLVDEEEFGLEALFDGGESIDWPNILASSTWSSFLPHLVLKMFHPVIESAADSIKHLSHSSLALSVIIGQIHLAIRSRASVHYKGLN